MISERELRRIYNVWALFDHREMLEALLFNDQDKLMRFHAVKAIYENRIQDALARADGASAPMLLANMTCDVSENEIQEQMKIIQDIQTGYQYKSKGEQNGR